MSTPTPRQASRPPGRGVAVAQSVALAAAVALVILTAGSYRWHPASLAVIAVLTIASDLTSVETGSSKLRVSGSFLGIILATVMLGGGPGALVGVLAIAVGWFRSRETWHYLRNNLATYAWFPLASGIFFHAVARIAHIGPDDLSYYLLVFATFALALAMNFLAIAGYQCFLDRSSLMQKAVEALAPLLAAELFSGMLAMAGVYIGVKLGTTGIGLFGLVLIVFQYLVGQLLVSKHRSNELHRMATTDELTGLANRERFRTQLQDEIERLGPDGAVGVLLLDLDRFKEINDTLGHHYGDLLLQDLGPRLVTCIGPDGLVARLGGDEFAVLPAGRTSDPELLKELASRLLAAIKLPFVADEVTLEVGASIGISRFPLDGSDAHSLLRCADIAMYAAKASQSGFKIYSPEQDRHSLQQLSLVSEVRRGLSLDEIVVYYQPVVDLTDMSVRGAEALVRWQHPQLGLLAPGAFIPVVEQTELIGPLTRYVLERAIDHAAEWYRDGRNLCVSVNLSVRNLLDRLLPRDLEIILSRHRLPPELLRLEITESMIMSDPERALATVTRLTDLGVGLSVDDFGTGHSSLANLRRLPIDELKLDRSFVTPMLNEDSDLVIVRSTINLAHDLGLTIVAEGVEDRPTLERLRLLGCDLAQGYHLSRPLPAAAFDEWLADTGLPEVPPVRLESVERVAA